MIFSVYASLISQLEVLLWWLLLTLLHSFPLCYSSLFLLESLTWPVLLLRIVKKNFYSANDQGWFDWRDVKAIVGGITHVRKRMDKIWHSEVKLCGREDYKWCVAVLLQMFNIATHCCHDYRAKKNCSCHSDIASVFFNTHKRELRQYTLLYFLLWAWKLPLFLISLQLVNT